MAAGAHDFVDTALRNIPTFLSFVWLDQNNNEYLRFKNDYSKMLGIDDHPWSYCNNKAFFLDTLKSIKLPQKIILIASGSLATEIMQDIDDLEQLQSVYIFCRIENYKPLAKSHRKILGIYSNRTFLYQALRANLAVLQGEEAGLEPSGLPHDVPTKWKKIKKSEAKCGGEGEVTKICLSTNEKTIAAIKIYTYDNKTRKMRAYREMTALKTLSNLTNVSHFYSPDTDPVTNIPGKLFDTLNKSDYTTFWAIMANIKGVTLKEFVTKRYSTHGKGFNLLDALTLTEKLLCIVKAIHTKGVVHRDLKPDNIMVSFQSYSDSTENAELFVIDFGLAYIETPENIEIDWSIYDPIEYEATDPGDSIGNRWYRVPQLDKQDVSHMTAKEKNDLFYVIRRSPIIDASSICAIFFWMLTQIVPEKNRDQNTNLAPHQRGSAKINIKINEVVSSMIDLSDPEREMLAKRLLIYLMTTFDKGFAFPDRQWTVEQLNYRLQLIRSVLDSHKIPSPPVETFDDVSDALVRLNDVAISAVSSSHEPISPLDKAASAFLFAKTKFIENHRRNYKWVDGSCQWLDDVHNMTERKHYDILTYYLLNQTWSIIVCCTANVNETGQYVLLSIGSIVRGLYIGIPIGQYEVKINSLDESDIYANFETELKNLIRLVCKRRAETR